MGYFKELSIINSIFTEEDCEFSVEDCCSFKLYQCALYPCQKHYDVWHKADVQEMNEQEDSKDKIRSDYYRYIKKKLIDERNLMRGVLK